MGAVAFEIPDVPVFAPLPDDGVGVRPTTHKASSRPSALTRIVTGQTIVVTERINAWRRLEAQADARASMAALVVGLASFVAVLFAL